MIIASAPHRSVSDSGGGSGDELLAKYMALSSSSGLSRQKSRQAAVRGMVK